MSDLEPELATDAQLAEALNQILNYMDDDEPTKAALVMGGTALQLLLRIDDKLDQLNDSNSVLYEGFDDLEKAIGYINPR